MALYSKFFASKSAPRDPASGGAESSVLDRVPVELPQLPDDAAAAILHWAGPTAVEPAAHEAVTVVDEPAVEAAAIDPMAGVLRIDGLDRFDEAFYLNAHPDVADAVARGDWHAGLMHYAAIGRAKGRVAHPEVDEAWYRATYPMAARDIAAGRAEDLADHYHRIGRYRGYLPSVSAARPNDPARCRSRFGGLWTDHGNALDVVEGRLDLGMITPAQAVLLRQWITAGYVILPQAIPEAILAPACADLELAYSGQIPDMRFAVHGVGQNVRWVPEARSNPAKALDLHWHSAATRDLIFAPAILDFLHLVFERRAMASKTLGFWRGSQQDGRQDSAHVNYSLPMQLAASWIALEDVVEGAGELFYHAGSHRIAEYLFQQRYKGTEEATRMGKGGPAIDGQIKEHIERIGLQAAGVGLSTGKLLAKRGDALIWAADLAHGGSRISGDRTRKSMVTNYCPSDCVPSYFEASPQLNCAHQREHYASGHYGRASITTNPS